MHQTRDKSGHDPLKLSRLFFFFSSDKSSDSITTSLKWCLVVFSVASVCLVFYSLSASQIRWFQCPECIDPTGTCETEPLAHYGTNSNWTTNSTATNISHIVFGIGGSTRTWAHRKQFSELWWQANITRGFVWLDEEPDPNTQWPETSPPYKLSSDWKKFRFSSSQSAVRIARVIVDSFRVGLPDVRWFVMGDDDTVFFTDNLVSVLARYDHRQMYYIGGNSESVEQDVRHAYDMAFGGGGFAISYPLAAELAKIMDGCLDRYFYFYGSDQRVWACAAELGVGLTIERGFHQFDIRGDAYGLLAAHPMAPLVSLHHLDAVKTLFSDRNQMESLATLMHVSRLDPARIMQQSICYHKKYKWSVSIAWGYVVQIYPAFLSVKELETPLQTFQTWRSWSDGPFTFNTRPVGSDICQWPIRFYLESMDENGRGETVTSYKKFVVKPEKKCDKAYHACENAVDRIIVSAMKMDPLEWTQAPRRHCCEIDPHLMNGVMKVRIRRCRRREIIAV